MGCEIEYSPGIVSLFFRRKKAGICSVVEKFLYQSENCFSNAIIIIV
jgi:hypothetical protein